MHGEVDKILNRPAQWMKTRRMARKVVGVKDQAVKRRA